MFTGAQIELNYHILQLNREQEYDLYIIVDRGIQWIQQVIMMYE